MQRHPDHTRARLAQTAQRLASVVHRESVDADALEVSERTGRVGFDEAQRLAYRPARLGEIFGPLWATFWFRVEGDVPASWAGDQVDLLWDSRSEATLWRDGQPVQGLHSGALAVRVDAPLLEPAVGGERIAVQVELACNGFLGDEGRFSGPPSGAAFARGTYTAATAPEAGWAATGFHARLERCALARRDADAHRLATDFGLLRALEAEHAEGLDPAWAGLLLSELNRFANTWAPGDRASWAPAQAILDALLARRNGSVTHEVVALGHAHMDTAWLWPLAETRRKLVRTLANQAALLERHPDLRFACSAAQHLAWIAEDQPALFDRLRALAAEERFVVVGGTWVEPDCNLPSGESLVRHFLYGQRWFERVFGRRCHEFWNPDVFGYTGQLPQLIRGAGMHRFVTQKLSWNQFTTPPSHTFLWQGSDGSEVLAHFPPADTYNAEVTVRELRFAAANFKDHDRTRTSLLLFGFGDGGGGPTPAMVDRLERVRDIEGVPRTRPGTADELFARIEAELDDPLRVVGELYFEMHRATFTTQAEIKRGNRAAELALHDAEVACTLADRLGVADYPADELEALTKRLLVCQFHDILPGSCIAEVAAEARADLAAARDGADALAGAALEALAVPGPSTPVNLAPVARREVAEAPDGELVVVAAAPHAAGARVEPDDAVTVVADGDELVLENAHLRARLTAGGAVVSLVHRSTAREALRAPGTRFELFEDRPVAWDAWDVDPSHLEQRADVPEAHAREVMQDGPLRAEVAFEHRVGAASALRQVVRLDAGAGRLEVHLTVDWRERHRFLKACLPLDVHADEATYEMAFGVARRPTHFSTAVDLARFEVPGHRFADLSEHGFGVAALSAGTYGWSALGADLRLSLLRGPTDPDPQADVGVHRIAFAILPHAGGWQDGGVVAEARRFNAPLRWAPGPLAHAEPLAATDDPNVVVDAVKRAEEEPETLVLRLYEAHGARGTAQVRPGVPFTRARLANLLEDPGPELAVAEGAIAVPYRPFEILTLLVS
jgi:alpha-mannosidase